MNVSQILSTVTPSGVTTADHLLQRRRDRHGFPVLPEVSSLFTRGCLEHGNVYHCDGPGALSMACALVSAATQANRWAVFVNLSFLNMDAAADLGVALHRVVSVQCPASLSAQHRAHVLGALVEGSDLVVVNNPQCSPSGARSVVTRAKRSGATVLILGEHCFSVDVKVSTHVRKWNFDDRLLSRSLAVQVHHQRTQQKSSAHVALPNDAGAVSVSA